MGGLPGHAGARHDYEAAQKEADTLAASVSHLPANQTLGDAVDYAAYVIARLTRDNLSPKQVANFNLDADRGYGYLCWDWLRDKKLKGVPAAFRNDPNQRQYNLPLHPGSGWCKHDALGDLPKTNDEKVQIRYIDREDKFA